MGCDEAISLFPSLEYARIGHNSPHPKITAAISDLAARLVPVLRRYGVVRAGIFGSVARGEARPDSDLDLLVEYRLATGVMTNASLVCHASGYLCSNN